jgi:hypothetical protein
MRKWLPILIACGLAGCANAPQPQTSQEKTAKTDEAITAALLPGTSTIKGQAFAKTADGEVRYAAGVPIYLLPKTPYVESCMNTAPPADASCTQKLSQFRFKTMADGEGRFEYLKLKPGTYYLEATMPWGVSSQAGAAPAGGIYRTQVKIETDDQTVTAVIH